MLVMKKTKKLIKTLESSEENNVGLAQYIWRAENQSSAVVKKYL